VNRLYALLPVLALAACAGPAKTLEVKQFHLRSEIITQEDNPMVRMEKQRRLHGAITAAERRNRLGQYYTLHWHDPAGAGQGAPEVVFQYQQGASASLIKRMSKSFPTADSSGTVEFAVVGEDYFTRGKVLTWKATLHRNGKELASRQSYLWQ